MGTVRIGKVLIMGGNKGRWQGTRDEMISLLARAKVEPYWYQGDGTAGEVRFRGIPIPEKAGAPASCYGALGSLAECVWKRGTRSGSVATTISINGNG